MSCCYAKWCREVWWELSTRGGFLTTCTSHHLRPANHSTKEQIWNNSNTEECWNDILETKINIVCVIWRPSFQTNPDAVDIYLYLRVKSINSIYIDYSYSFQYNHWHFQACHVCSKHGNISIRGCAARNAAWSETLPPPLLWKPDFSPLSSCSEPNTTLIHDQFGWWQKNSIVELTCSILGDTIEQPIQHRAGLRTLIPWQKYKHIWSQCEKAS